MEDLGPFIEKYKEKGFSFLTGRAPPFWPPRASRPSPALAPARAAHRRPDRAQAPVDANWVASGGPRSPRSPSPAPRLTLPHSLTPPPLPSVTHSSRARAPASATTPMRTLVGVCRFGHHSSPPAPPSSSEHRLLFAQPMLALARSGNAPILGNCSPEIGYAHRGRTAPWTPPFRFTSRPLFSRTSTPPCP
jgi:hypothetical protein